MLEYQNLTNDEILRLVDQKEQLTDEARLALDAELSRRKIGETEIRNYEAESAAAAEAEKLNIRPRLVIYRAGLGTKFFGKRNRVRDSISGLDEYDTTLWFVLFWFPFFPIATYTIRRKLHPWWNIFSSDEASVIRRRPRDWDQVLLTWIEAMAILFALRVAFLWVNR